MILIGALQKLNDLGIAYMGKCFLQTMKFNPNQVGNTDEKNRRYNHWRSYKIFISPHK